MSYIRTFALWAFMLALEFVLIFLLVRGLDLLNPSATQSLAALAVSSLSVFATLMLGAIAVRTFATAARNGIGLRDAGARAALQTWMRSRRP